MTWNRDSTAIVGIGSTDFSRNSGRSELRLAVEASGAALEDAGIDVRSVDGIVRCEADRVWHNDLAEALGIPNLTYWGACGPGGVSPAGQIAQAVGAICSGQASVVLCIRALNGYSDLRIGSMTKTAGPISAGGNGSYDEFYAPYGFGGAPAAAYAMAARRHMIEYGTTEEQLGRIALACRENANRNPRAQMYERRMTMADYLDSPRVATPLKRFDCCLQTDGACAVVVTSAERARDSARTPAYIRAVAMGSGPRPGFGMIDTVLARESITSWPSRFAARTLYERAGLGPADIDVAQLYDCFTITVLIQIEDYGFCAKGDGGPFVESGAIARDGSIPINTAGGQLSEGYIPGMNAIVEGVRQIRGTSTTQIAGAQTCLVTSGTPPPTGAMILVGEGAR